MNQKLKLIVFISGQGSNLQAIIDNIHAQKLAAEIVCVVSDKPQAYGLTRAKIANIPTEIIEISKEQNIFSKQLIGLVEQYGAELIVLAGFMRVLPSSFVKNFSGKIINIHPSLLPKYPGLKTYERVLENKDLRHGVTIHFVTEAVDAGPIIAQTSLDVRKEDTIESLKARIHSLEHQLYPLIISWFCENRLHLSRSGIKYNNQEVPLMGIQIDLTE